VGTAGGNWSNPANWVGGAVPDSGGTASFITLPTFTTAPINVFQDQANVTLSGIHFNSFITYLLDTPAGSPTNSFTLVGPATIHSNTQSINTLSTTSFGQLIRTPITGSAGLTKTGPGTVTLWAANSYTGGTTINGGIVVARQVGDLAFGEASGSITLNDGTIRVTTGAFLSSRTINLMGNGTFEPSTGNQMSFGGSVIGAGQLNKIGGGTLTMDFFNFYTGATNVYAGTLLFNGGGHAPNTAAVTSRANLVLDNSLTVQPNRLNDAAPVTLHGSALTLTGNAAAAASETLGNTTFSRGMTTVTVTPGASGASLSMGASARDTGGVAFFRGTSLGAAPGANVANVTFAVPPTLVGGGGAPGSTNIGIIPWAFGSTFAGATPIDNPNSLVTYGPNGVRPLNTSTEYVTNIIPAGPTDNVRLGGGEMVNGAKTINSLVLSGSGVLTGPGTLTIASGALLSLVHANISCGLEFGSAEGILYLPAGANLTGVISGSGGLTKQGAGVATFAASNTYSGTTTIGGGTAVFRTDVASGANSPFGNSTSAVVLAPAGIGTGGTTARLVYGNAATATFARDLLVSGRVARNNAAILPGFGVNGASSLVMNGDITLDDSALMFVGGAGSSVTINGDITGSGGPITDQGGAATIALNGNNTFAGGAELSASTWAIGSDSAFGSGMLKMVQLAGQPTLIATGGPRGVPNETVSFSFSSNYWNIAGSNPLTFTGSINLSGSYTHNINNTATTTYAGVLHTGGFTKAGSGTLVLSGSNVYTGATTINSGVLRVTNSGALGSSQSPTTVANDGVLQLAGNAMTAEPVQVNGSGAGLSGTIRSVSGHNSLGDATFNAGSTIAVDSGTLSTGRINGVLPGGATIVKQGPGTLNVHSLRTHHFNIHAGTVAVTLGGDPLEKVSRVANFVIVGSPDPIATLDLGDTDLISIEPPLIVQIEDLIAHARNGGAWDRPGITSSAARTHASAATTLGVLSGSEYLAVDSGTFDGFAVNSFDALIKYTYYGDTDFNGMIDGDDYARIDGGFNMGLSGWLNGDCDLNGVIDGDDYALIDNAFSTQSGTLRRAMSYLSGDDRSARGMDHPVLQRVGDHFSRFGLPYAEHFLASVPEPAIPLVSGMMALGTRRRPAKCAKSHRLVSSETV
jgi:autotransporter-associated beta strand protein